jgi:cyanate lyase
MWGVKLIEFLLRLLQKLPIHKSIDYYVPTEPMIIHDSIIESITYWLQQPTR